VCAVKKYRGCGVHLWNCSFTYHNYIARSVCSEDVQGVWGSSLELQNKIIFKLVLGNLQQKLSEKLFWCNLSFVLNRSWTSLIFSTQIYKCIVFTTRPAWKNELQMAYQHSYPWNYLQEKKMYLISCNSTSATHTKLNNKECDTVFSFNKQISNSHETNQFKCIQIIEKSGFMPNIQAILWLHCLLSLHTVKENYITWLLCFKATLWQSISLTQCNKLAQYPKLSQQWVWRALSSGILCYTML
jgi:hypothetical protein